MAVVETRHGKVAGKETDGVSSSVLLAERRLREGHPDGTTDGKF
jgi:hypothetical protein